MIWDERKSDYPETDFKLNTGIEGCSHLYRVEYVIKESIWKELTAVLNFSH